MHPFSLLLSLALTGALAAPPEVSVLVRNHTGTNLLAAPVRGGIPFARGALRECTTGRLTTDAGKEVPCRVRPTARWYDGSVKWLLIDAQVDCPARAQVRLRFLPGSPPKPIPRALTITRDADSITIDTGPARFRFSKRVFGLPAAAWADLDGDGRWDTKVVSQPGDFACEVEHQSPGPPEEENWLRDATGAPRDRYEARAAGDYTAEVEKANDLHAVVKLGGWLVNPAGRRLLQYVIRAHAYAGRPDLRILHTFVFAGKPKQDFVRTISLRLPFDSSGDVKWALGGDRPHTGALAAGDAVSLSEIGPRKLYHLVPYTEDKTVYYEVERVNAPSAQPIARGKEAAGWARLADARSSMQFAMRNFWQMHPKELRLDARGMTVYLWPEAGGKVLDLRRRSDEIDNVYHYDLSLWPYGGEGVGVSHEMMLRFGPARDDSAAHMSAALNAPVLLECVPEYYAASGAFGPFAVSDPAKYPHLEGFQNVAVEWMRQNQRAFHWDGMIDYGDTLFHGYATPSHYGYVGEKAWCSRGYVGWLCNDSTFTQALFMQYLRTGDYDTFLAAEAMCRHVTEVDTCHFCAEEPGQVGGGHRHDQQHWGNGVRGYGTATHGAITYYLLTGDERALEVAREYVRYHTDGVPSENEDRIGGLLRMWEITGDPKLKQKADEFLAAELAPSAGGGWPFATAAHFRFVSNMSVSLLYYLQAAPPQDCVKPKEAIVNAANSIEAETVKSWGQVDYLPLIVTSLAYEFTGDRRYLDETACLLQRLALPWDMPVPPSYTGVLRALSFEQMVETARAWNVNNLYGASIHGLVPLPYVLAALQAGGMEESAMPAVKRDSTPPPPFEEVIPPASMAHEVGNLYQGSLQHGAPSDIAGGYSTLILLEDGKPLGPAHSAHADVRKLGNGRWSHWGARVVWFSTSDNTDPRTNGRQYKVIYPGSGK
jgi:hypothetical protein